MRIKLTQAALERVKAPATGRMVVYDTEEAGLCVVITSNDARAFYVVKKYLGRVHWVRLGGVGEMTIDNARDAAADARSDIRKGIDANAQKRQQREAATLLDVWTAYRTAVSKAPRTMSEDAGLWSRYLEPWQNRRVADISSEAVQKLYNRILAGEVDRESLDKFGHKRPIKGGASAARHTVKLLREMFNAMAETYAIEKNPAKNIRQQKEVTCERYITPDEFPLFWAALDQQDELIRDALKLAIFTGQRRANLLAMRWEHVNLNFRSWTIPAGEMKSRRMHTVPLPDRAMEILERRRKADPAGEWVLNNPGSDVGHLVNPEKAVERIWKAAGITAFSLHDLRRTCATWLNSAGANETTVQAALGHASRGVLGVYMKSSLDTLRTALQAACDAMTAAAGMVPTAATTEAAVA